MGSGFQHDIAGGQGNLIIAALQSPNFVHNVSGWQIAKNGNVEFNSGTFRGTVTASTFQGTDFIINSAGAFFYNGVPALGNLVVSIAPVSGTDAFGNNFGSGIAVGNQTGAHTGFDLFGNLFVQNNSNVIVDQIASGDGSIRIYSSGGAGSGSLICSISPVSGSDSFSNAYLQGLTTYNGNNAVSVSGNGRLTWYTASSPAGPWSVLTTASITQTDSTVLSVAVASITAITKHWSIPANDANIGTVYRQSAYGIGTQGSTQQNLFIDGNNGNPTVQMLGTEIGISAIFSWWAETEMRVTATGVSGKADVKTVFGWQQNAVNNLSNNSFGVQVAHGVGFDTTVNQTVQIRMKWNSITGAPTITCDGSTFERLGP